jgi:hypothetical protein
VKVEQIAAKAANLFDIRGGKVTRLAAYADRELAMSCAAMYGGTDDGVMPGGRRPPRATRV